MATEYQAHLSLMPEKCNACNRQTSIIPKCQDVRFPMVFYQKGLVFQEGQYDESAFFWRYKESRTLFRYARKVNDAAD